VVEPRPTIDAYFLEMASVVASRATCARRRVGCVLVSPRQHVLATGRNGPPSGWTHCIESPCPGAASASGKDLDLCEAIHAEQNALLQCRDVWEIESAYCTTAPCVTCVKLFLNTSCHRIVFVEDYPHSEKSAMLWRKDGRDWTFVGEGTDEIPF
jgi:dCMP deaminase